MHLIFIANISKLLKFNKHIFLMAFATLQYYVQI
jgi:hypothetical protein